MLWQTEDLSSLGLDAESAALLFEGLVMNAFESVTITDASLAARADDWRISFVNPAFEEMTGYKKEEAVGQTPKMLQGPKTDREVLDRLNRDLSEGRVFHGETVNYRKDGSEFVIEWKVIPIKNRQGEVTRYLALQRDVTARR